MRFCECGRNHFDPTHQGFGGLIICSLCNGFVQCDFCKSGGAELDNPFMSIAKYDIAESFACWHHAWISVAKALKFAESSERSN
jgi:hypothetical protein